MAAVLTLSGARSELGPSALERHVACALSFSLSNVTVTIDGGDVTIILYPENDDGSIDADAAAAKLNAVLQTGDAAAWAASEATCEAADDEESEYINEEEALEMWRGMSEEARTSHLDAVPSPDGVMIQPTNETRAEGATTDADVSPTESQLRRDPTLLQFDNVRRVDASQLDNISWNEPIIISGAISEEIFADSDMLDRQRLASTHGNVEVRTGNRETLIDNGITNSKPLPLREALLQPSHAQNIECGTIVFSPVKELSDELAGEMKQFTDLFPSYPNSPMKKFTLTIASEGFGIGMHKHNAAMFMLLKGRKKWYMASSEGLEGDAETHPGFYREKSSHKCIQEAREVLFVPHDWYHEIFNLEYTAGVQGLP